MIQVIARDPERFGDRSAAYRNRRERQRQADKRSASGERGRPQAVSDEIKWDIFLEHLRAEHGEKEAVAERYGISLSSLRNYVDEMQDQVDRGLRRLPDADDDRDADADADRDDGYDRNDYAEADRDAGYEVADRDDDYDRSRRYDREDAGFPAGGGASAGPGAGQRHCDQR